MAASFEDKPNQIPWPPIIYAAALAAAIALSFAIPLPWLPSPFSDIALAAGVLFAVAAIAVVVLTLRTLRAANTTYEPHRASQHLVTEGPFSFSRNPIYLANTAFVMAIGLIFGTLWFVIVALVAAFATQKLAIVREEKHLSAKFGKRYRDYCKRVKRWL